MDPIYLWASQAILDNWQVSRLSIAHANLLRGCFHHLIIEPSCTGEVVWQQMVESIGKNIDTHKINKKYHFKNALHYIKYQNKQYSFIGSSLQNQFLVKEAGFICFVSKTKTGTTQSRTEIRNNMRRYGMLVTDYK